MAAPIAILSTVPHTDCLAGRPWQLARALAASGRKRVVYVEMPGLWTAARQLRKKAAPDSGTDRLSVIRLPSMPRNAGLAESRTGNLRAQQIAQNLRRSVPDLASGWVIVSDPGFAPVLRHLRVGRLCFDCADHPRVFAGPRAKSLDPSWYRELLARGDLVTWVNPRIRQYLADGLDGKPTCWVANGVPASWTMESTEGLTRRTRRDGRLVAGFLGALFEWVDLELLAETARRLPGVQFVLAGPARWRSPVAVLRGLPNLVHLGPRSFQEAREVLDSFDVGLIPFVRDEVGECCDPIKLYEYLASGLPVVSTLELAPRPSMPSISVGAGPDGFTGAVIAALDERSPSHRQARIEFASRNTWERRAGKMLAAMQRVDDPTSKATVVSISRDRVPASRSRLRVLFVVRADLERYPGGDTVQIRETAEALQRLGVSVTITSNPCHPLGTFDCAHLWHLERLHETIVPWYRLRRAGTPVLLSPIYWPASFGNREQSVAKGLLEDGKNLYRFLKAESAVERHGALVALTVGWRRARHRLLYGADMLLPNSQAEAAILAVESRGSVPIKVVHSAADESLCSEIRCVGSVDNRHGVLSVGHFDPRKNQLGLIQAMLGVDEPLTLIGGPRRMHKRYFERCRSEAGPNVSFLGVLPRDAVLRAMLTSRIHVCPSFYETPGLANLEAARMGCPLVLPECPPVREYLGDKGVYFRPGCPQSLGQAIQRALDWNPGSRSRTVASGRVGWEIAAEETLGAYLEVLQQDRSTARFDGPALAVEQRVDLRSSQ